MFGFNEINGYSNLGYYDGYSPYFNTSGITSPYLSETESQCDAFVSTKTPSNQINKNKGLFTLVGAGLAISLALLFKSCKILASDGSVELFSKIGSGSLKAAKKIGNTITFNHFNKSEEIIEEKAMAKLNREANRQARIDKRAANKLQKNTDNKKEHNWFMRLLNKLCIYTYD